MKPHKIERLYAWVVTHADGEDGIPAVASAHGPLPLVGSDKARIESFRSVAEALARTGPGPVRLVEFSAMVVLETIPAGGN